MGGCGGCLGLVALFVAIILLLVGFGFIVGLVGLAGETGPGWCGRDGGWRGRVMAVSASVSVSGCGGQGFVNCHGEEEKMVGCKVWGMMLGLAGWRKLLWWFTEDEVEVGWWILDGFRIPSSKLGNVGAPFAAHVEVAGDAIQNACVFP